MPRPPSDLKTVSVYLSPAEIAEADRQAAALGLLSERGTPNRSALLRRLIAENARRLARQSKAATPGC